MRLIQIAILGVCCTLLSAVSADETPPSGKLGLSQEPLAVMGEVTLTQAELDGALSRIPDDKRLMFVRNGAMVEQLVRNLLNNKALAAEAVKAGYDQDTLVKLRLQLGREGALAKEWLTKVVLDAPDVDYVVIAEEQYLLNPEAWKTGERVDVSHILISTDTRSKEEAMDQIGLIWQKLQVNPEQFDQLVEEYSEDPAKEANGGRYPDVQKGDMVANFEAVAFTMTMPGEISAPTETPYGFHIIRLNERLPGKIPTFEEVKEAAVIQAREEYLTEYQNNYMKQLFAENIEIQEGAAEKLAKRYFGENLELAPDFTE